MTYTTPPNALSPGPWEWTGDMRLDDARGAAVLAHLPTGAVCIPCGADRRAIECVPEMVRALDLVITDEDVCFGGNVGLAKGILDLLAYIERGGERPEVK